MSEAWIKASGSVSSRDKALRVLQYGSVMLLAYYQGQLSKESFHKLQGIRRSASSARRCFRLLKSINHISKAFDSMKLLVVTGCGNEDDELLVVLTMLQEMCWATLYYYDNCVFLSRLGILSCSQLERNRLYRNSIVFWFIGECLKLSSTVYEHAKYVKRQNALSFCQHGGNMNTEEIRSEELECQQKASDKLHWFSYAKSICNILLSASLIDKSYCTNLLGQRRFDIVTGFLGVATAAVGLYENTSSNSIVL